MLVTIVKCSCLLTKYCRCVDLNNSIDGLRMVNTTVVKLLNLTLRLQDELTNLTSSLMTLQNDCNDAGNPGGVCDDIPTQSYDVVDYSLVRNMHL